MSHFHRMMQNKVARAEPDGAGSGASDDSQQTPNGSADSQNNSGQEGESFADYWNSPAAGSSPDADAATPKGATPAGDQSGDAGTLTAFETQMQGLAFPEFMTAEVAEQMNNGDFTGMNAGLTKSMQDGVKQTLLMTAKMLNAFETRMTEKMGTISNNNVSMRDARNALQTAIPSAKNPGMAPIIEGIFAQAMKHTQGDSAKAIEATKGFMKQMTTMQAADLGMQVTPPGSPGFGGDPANSGDSGDMPTDWANEIFGHLATDD